MKILHVIPSIGPNRGGPSFALRTLVRGLAESGVEVHVAATDDNGRGRLDVQCGVPVSEARVTFWFFPRQTRFYTVSWSLNRWLRLHVADYDLVHIHALFSFSSVATAYWAKRRKVPYIVRPLGTLNRWGIQRRRPWLKRLSLWLLESHILSGAAAVHYTSNQERLEAAESGVTEHSLVIPNPFDELGAGDLPTRGRLRLKYPDLADRAWILFLSRFDRIKGLDLLLTAFAQLRPRYPHTALILAGDGDPVFVSRLRRRAAELQIDGDIIWTGFLEFEDKRSAFADADLFVLPSYSENFGIAALEAMAAGVPIVISDKVAIHREVAEAGAGAVVACDVGKLRDALAELLSSAEKRDAMGRRGQELARSRFSLDSVVHALTEAYIALAN